MTGVAIVALLTGAVLCGVLAVLGFVRLRGTLDRLHCAAFCNASVGLLLTAAAFLSDGCSDRALKIALIALVALVGGAASSHVVGRAMLARGDIPEALPLSGLPTPDDPPRRNGELG